MNVKPCLLGKKEKNTINLSCVELAQRVVKVNDHGNHFDSQTNKRIQSSKIQSKKENLFS